MKNLVRVFLTILSYCGTQGQVISKPGNALVCEGREAVFTCVLNSNIRSDDVQWYRFINDTSTTEMVDPDGDNISFITNTIGNTTNSSLTITNVIKSYTGYFWVGTPSLNVCNASLTVLTGPPALKVSIMKLIENSSIVAQWEVVDDWPSTTYIVNWYSSSSDTDVKTLTQTSYTITGLTLDTVYTITIFAQNDCGSGPKFTTSIGLSATTTSTTSSISPTVTVSTSTNPIAIMSTDTTMMNPSTNSANSINPSTTSTNSMDPSTTSTNSMDPSTTSTNPMITTSIDTAINNVRTTTTAVNDPIITISTDTLLLSTSPAQTTMANNEMSTEAVVIITFAVTFILTLTVTAIITSIVTYFCVKRTLEKSYNNNNNHNKQSTQDQALYEHVCLPSHTKSDLEPQPNPAYGTSHKVIMDTNPAYASCK